MRTPVRSVSIGSDNGLSPIHYLNQYWVIVNWTLMNKFQWSFQIKTKKTLFISSENIVCEMAAPSCPVGDDLMHFQYLSSNTFWKLWCIPLNPGIGHGFIILCVKLLNCAINLLNSLWPSDIICRHRTGSTLDQVMACCLAAPSHCLNQCWLIISKVLWHSSEDISKRRTNQ